MLHPSGTLEALLLCHETDDQRISVWSVSARSGTVCADAKWSYRTYLGIADGAAVSICVGPEELIIREQIVAALWKEPQSVDIRQGINTAVTRLRAVLGDDPAAPRYIETVIGKGYRFIAGVEELEAEEPRQGGPDLDTTPLEGMYAEALATLRSTSNADEFLAYVEGRVGQTAEAAVLIRQMEEGFPDPIGLLYATPPAWR